MNITLICRLILICIFFYVVSIVPKHALAQTGGEFSLNNTPQGLRYEYLSSDGYFPHSIVPTMNIGVSNPAALYAISSVITGITYQYNSPVKYDVSYAPGNQHVRRQFNT